MSEWSTRTTQVLQEIERVRIRHPWRSAEDRPNVAYEVMDERLAPIYDALELILEKLSGEYE